MRAIDERLAFLEGRVAEQSQMFSDLTGAMASMEQRIEARLNRIDDRLVRMDGRDAEVQLELSKQLRWVVGIQVTTLITIVAALVGTLTLR